MSTGSNFNSPPNIQNPLSFRKYRVFETEKEVLDWYERQSRSLTKTFVSQFPWAKVRNNFLDPAFVPVLVYMRDVESFTDIYYREMLRTPTGKDPSLRRFMERWVVEEAGHAEALNRFLQEAGASVDEQWCANAKAAIPRSYTIGNYFATAVSNLFGRSFTGTHMVWGAINEMTTLQGYRRLERAARHPLLSRLLQAIVREESTHANFYFQIARVRMTQSRAARQLARFAVKRFWTPVGQGAKPSVETDYLITTLFAGQEGVAVFDRTVSHKIRQLPGFAFDRTITDRVSRISLALE